MVGPFGELRSRDGSRAATSPFSDQPGTPPPALTGREPQLRRILAVIEQVEAARNGGALFLPGPRGLGKTSLLVETAAEADRRGITVVRVELARDGAEATSLLLAALSQAVGRSGLSELAAQVNGVQVGPIGIELSDRDANAPASVTHLLVEAARACASTGGLLVLVDEAQEHPPTAAAVVRAGHRASQDGLAFASVLAGLPRAVRDVVAEVSYAERIPSSPLGPLGPEDAFAAIARPLADNGLALPETRRAHVSTVTGGYPFFVQVLGHQLWIAADPDDAHTISADVWRRAVAATVERTDRWLGDRFDRVPPSEQRYLVAANRVGWPASTGAVAAELGSDHASLSPARAALIDDGLLWVPARGLVELVVPPLAGWIDRHRS